MDGRRVGGRANGESGLGWNSYLSYLNQQGKKRKGEEGEGREVL